VTHNISFRTVSRALRELTNKDPSQGALWTRLCIQLYGDEDVTSWAIRDDLIQPSSMAPRKALGTLSSHPERAAAAEFNRQRRIDIRKKIFQRLEDDGVIVGGAALRR